MAYTLDALLVKVLEGDLAVVTIEVHAVVGEGIAVSGEGVVGAAGIVARTLTSILAEEDTACVDHFGCQTFVVVSGNDKVFGGITVAQVDSFVRVVDEY